MKSSILFNGIATPKLIGIAVVYALILALEGNGLIEQATAYHL